MAEKWQDPENTKPAPSGKGGGALQLVFVALIVSVTVLGAVGGAFFWLLRSGRLGAPAVAAAPASPAPEPKKPEPPPGRMLLLDPLLVNLSDGGGSGYLRVVMALRVEDPPPAKGEKPKEEKAAEKGKSAVNEDEVRLRDVALDVLSRETSDGLLATDGKHKLKSELNAAFAERIPTLRIHDILFTEFLVQR